MCISCRIVKNYRGFFFIDDILPKLSEKNKMLVQLCGRAGQAAGENKDK